MAFKIVKGLSEISVVPRVDDAITCNDDEYADYIASFSPESSGDESILKLSEEPTRFVLRLNLSWDAKRKVDSNNMSIKGRSVSVDPYYTKDLLRHSFKAIKNPPQVPLDQQIKFVKDSSDKLISKSFMNDLESMGEIENLVTALSNAKSKSKEEEDSEQIEKN